MSEQNNGHSNGHSNGNGEAAKVALVPFDYLRGNVKGTFEHQLNNQCVAFVGKNRHGKTARLEAFRLALTGEHPVGPHGSNLMELAPEGAFGLEAVVRTGPEGSPVQASMYRVDMEGGKPRKAEKPDRQGKLRDIEQAPGADKAFENMLPGTTMRDLIKLGSTLGREAIFRRFGEITSIPTPRGLSDTQKALWAEGLAETKKSKPKADTAEVLAASSAWFRQRKLALGRDIKALKDLVKEREARSAPEMAGAEDLPGLRAQLESALAWERSASLRASKAALEADAVAYRAKVTPIVEADKAENKAARATQLQLDRDARTAAVADVQTQLDALTDAFDTFDIEHQAKVKKEVFYLTGGEWLQECLHVMAGKVDADGHTSCLLCGNSCHVETLQGVVDPRVSARRASVVALYELREAKLVELQAARADVTRALEVVKRALNDWEAEVSRHAQDAENVKTALRLEGTRIKSALDQNTLALQSVPAAYEGPTAVELLAKIQALEAAETVAKNLDAETAKVRQLTLDQEVAKVLEQEASKSVSTLLAKTSETANAAVNKYMPEGFRAVLDLETAQWTVIGQDSRVHGKKVMAGSEFGALTVALALAWTEGAPGRFLTLDDEDLAFFDPENLALLLTALRDACDDGLLTQVLLAWSRPDEIPETWQKIRVDQPPTSGFLSVPAATATLMVPDNGPAVLL